jgi:hypothetical protein
MLNFQHVVLRLYVHNKWFIQKFYFRDKNNFKIRDLNLLYVSAVGDTADSQAALPKRLRLQHYSSTVGVSF